jgi:integrase/recombinase XerD
LRRWPGCRRLCGLSWFAAGMPAAAFLLGYRGHTRRAYFGDIRAWYAWCAGNQSAAAGPAAPRGPVDRRAGRAPATRHRQAGSGRHHRPPVVRPGRAVRMRRHRRRADRRVASAAGETARVSERSSTTGFTETELIALLGPAEADSARYAALITLLALNGLRVGEALSLDAPDLSYDFGHRVLALTRKGGTRSVEALAPATRPRPGDLPRRPPNPPCGASSAASPAPPASPPRTSSAHTACGTLRLSPLP